ncbi:hypothetical protein HYV12_01635 [Candidatus Dojkabacteria bacterium]|nr:hypothetical protein [Candidatus Dojkabacteria bacterium]
MTQAPIPATELSLEKRLSIAESTINSMIESKIWGEFGDLFLPKYLEGMNDPRNTVTESWNNPYSLGFLTRIALVKGNTMEFDPIEARMMLEEPFKTSIKLLEKALVLEGALSVEDYLILYSDMGEEGNIPMLYEDFLTIRDCRTEATSIPLSNPYVTANTPVKTEKRFPF